ncbi:MAG TPA: RNA polymerase sigma factor [Anaerolineales bacterium]|nr:RNA polymerase sigma factor [Anaerolineales bacterium]HNO86291.1 RNA polymerase sigma factor [Anaerolineales bacterium]
MENENPRGVNVDSQTVQRALGGDRSALAQIYDACAQPIYRYHFSRVGNSADAEDLTSQTFMAVIESLPRYQHRNNFKAWVFQLARNKLVDHFRGNHSHAEIGDWVVDPAQGDVLETLVWDESRTQLKSLLNSLDEEDRELLRLRYSAGLSFVEIAQLFGRKEDAVRKAIRRILDRLTIQMEAQNA